VAEGRHSAARAALAGAAERARREGQHSLEAAALHDLARLGDAASVRERTAALAATVQGELMAARALHVDGLAHDDGDRLDAAAGSFAALDCHLFAAEAAVAAATAHRRGGAARRAAASELVARSHAERCEGAATPALRSTPAAPELTRREQEVAGLAASGRSNREIADELVVSVRTVENHLQRVYAKVGVRSREELARALDPG
jgi:DNA-binding CsgD family transcriptional regulator